MAVLFVSGIIEAFVTPSGLPTSARVAIGITAEAGFLRRWVCVWAGRRSTRGASGDVDAGYLEDRVATQE